MGLKNLTERTETINTSGGDFTVRGLTLPDVARLARRHGAPLSKLFDMVAGSTIGGRPAIPLDDINALAGAFVEVAPQAAVEAIALAASENGEPDDEEMSIAKRLTLSVQIDALEKIGRLTFDTEDGPKKVLETVVKVIRGVRGTMGVLKA